MADQPTPIVVISASIERDSLASSMDALRAGALSVVEKPVGFGDRDYAAVAREICTQLAIMSDVAVVRRRIQPRAPNAAGLRTITPSLRGFGDTRFRSEDTPRTGNSARLAIDAIELMDALGIEHFCVAST